jgi:predicted PurR-regulated permease PerM
MAATDRQHVTAVLFYIALGVFLYFVLPDGPPFLVPLGWAAVLVIVFHPVHSRLERRYGPSRAAA